MTMEESLIIRAFGQAIALRRPQPGLIIHRSGDPVRSGWTVFRQSVPKAARQMGLSAEYG
ncbi:hypothetical protein EXU85_26020 [Spirosoma sp. KCTC 42546]|uniref:hypothetical protein n=1 Tax=Spirosoma sp. KCTC 42546 TaxID=2520506 RepID=UPI00115BD2C8|nr:hypothetical protein [Spirosoma sp. KCTC 42546]QDK81879.1 hypothetical protein EXU85_26020 [Spirosoma sp. KCTC 42546]